MALVALLSFFSRTNNVAATTKPLSTWQRQQEKIKSLQIWGRAHSYLNGRNYIFFVFVLNQMGNLSAWNDIRYESVFSSLKQIKTLPCSRMKKLLWEAATEYYPDLKRTADDKRLTGVTPSRFGKESCCNNWTWVWSDRYCTGTWQSALKLVYIWQPLLAKQAQCRQDWEPRANVCR